MSETWHDRSWAAVESLDAVLYIICKKQQSQVVAADVVGVTTRAELVVSLDQRTRASQTIFHCLFFTIYKFQGVCCVIKPRSDFFFFVRTRAKRAWAAAARNTTNPSCMSSRRQTLQLLQTIVIDWFISRKKIAEKITQVYMKWLYAIWAKKSIL